MSANTLFILILKPSELQLDAITQVSSAYKMILALLLGILANSLIHRRKNGGPRIEPRGTSCLTISHPEEILLRVFLICLLSRR
jgi:hypothetical protein